MSQTAASLPVVVVGADADASACLHLYLDRAGCSMHCVPLPGQLEGMARAVAAKVVVVLLPGVLDESWKRALTAANAMSGTARVTAVTSSSDVSTHLAAFPDLRAVGRTDLLARPTLVLERPPAPPPVPPVARAEVDLLSLIEGLIEDELEEPLVGEHVGLERIDVSVTALSPHNFYVGSTGRLDSGGVFVATGAPPLIGTPVQLTLMLADGRKLESEGEVAWVRPKSGVTRSYVPGCGIRLSSVPDWAVRAIEAFMKARPPIRIGS